MSSTNALRGRLVAVLLAVGVAVAAVVTAPANADTGVIVRARSGGLDQALTTAARLGARDLRPLGVIDGFAADLPAGAVGALRADPAVLDVAPDRVLRPRSRALTQTALGVAAVGAPSAWSQGIDGKGVDVALIDSGVAASAGFRGRNVAAGVDLSGSSSGSSLTDEFGHGTHMAGIIAGSVDEVHGLAWKGRVVSVKVAGSDGVTTASKVIAGLDWVVEHARRDDRNIRVVNLSFGVDVGGSYLQDPLAYAVERVWSAGVVVTAAVGNDGSVDSPARDPYVVAVGAAEFDDLGRPRVAGWSSCDPARGPDVVAPGASILSVRAPGSTLDVAYPTARLGDHGFVGSGTSQATAVVSALVMLVLQARPELSPDQVKEALMASAAPLSGASTDCQGAGLVRVDRALTQAVGATDQQSWPRVQLGIAPGTVPDECRIALDDAAAGDPSTPVCEADGAPLGSHWSGSHWSGSHWSGSHWSGSHWSTAVWG